MLGLNLSLANAGPRLKRAANLASNPGFESDTSDFSASGYVLDFTGGTDYVTIPYDADTLGFTGGTDPVTVECIFKVDNVSEIHRLGGQGTAILARTEISGGVEFILNSFTTNDRISGGSVSENTWHHFLGTYDPSDNEIRVYLDGANVGSITPTGTYTGGTADWLIGDTGTEALKGNVKLFRIFKASTSDAQALELYRGANIPNVDSLSAEYLFEDGSGTTLTDTSGNSNDGTITGATWVDARSVLFQSSAQAKFGSNSLLVEGNAVVNGDFEDAPASNALQTADNWIDGTASGSATEVHKWYANVGGGNSGAMFDSTEKYTGTHSMKLATTGTGSFVEAHWNSSAYYGAGSNNIDVKPNTAYRLTFKMKTTATVGDSDDGAYAAVLGSDGNGTGITTWMSTKVKTTTGWTEYTLDFTTPSNVTAVNINCRIYGHTGTGTLVIDAWFDDVKLIENYPASGTKHTLSGLTSGQRYNLSAFFYQDTATDHCGILLPGEDSTSIQSDGNWNWTSLNFTAAAATQDVYFLNFDGTSPFYVDQVDVHL